MIFEEFLSVRARMLKKNILVFRILYFKYLSNFRDIFLI